MDGCYLSGSPKTRGDGKNKKEKKAIPLTFSVCNGEEKTKNNLCNEVCESRCVFTSMKLTVLRPHPTLINCYRRRLSLFGFP